jgi:hypothetical protein
VRWATDRQPCALTHRLTGNSEGGRVLYRDVAVRAEGAHPGESGFRTGTCNSLRRLSAFESQSNFVCWVNS